MRSVQGKIPSIYISSPYKVRNQFVTGNRKVDNSKIYEVRFTDGRCMMTIYLHIMQQVPQGHMWETYYLFPLAFVYHVYGLTKQGQT